MNTSNKNIIAIILFIIGMIAIFIICATIFSSQNDSDEIKRTQMIGNVQFKGKVIDYQVYSFSGKPYVMICVRLDYSTVKKTYILNDLCALKIKDNIATMSGGAYSQNGCPTYVEVNLNHTGRTKFYWKGGKADEFEWLLNTNGLTEKDLNHFNKSH